MTAALIGTAVLLVIGLVILVTLFNRILGKSVGIFVVGVVMDVVKLADVVVVEVALTGVVVDRLGIDLNITILWVF